MKLAILGSSPIAFEAALRFHLHGGSISWFNYEEVEYELLFNHSDPFTYTSQTGRDLLKEQGKEYSPGRAFDFSNWKENYLAPLTELMRADQRIRSHEVVSIAKRYLSLQEKPTSSTRFLDLFRVIFKVNPEEFIKEQKTTNPETFERLTKEMIDSLQSNIEMYEDFDLVIDLRKSVDPRSLSVTGRALGEGRVSKDQLLYGFEALKKAREINREANDVRELALVGSGSFAAEIAINLANWLKDPRSRLFVVSAEANPFENYLKEAETSSKTALNNLFAFMDSEFQKEIDEFYQKLRDWQELDDFVQAKKPRPVEPIPRLVFFSGHTATAVDQLIDKRRLFLTLEKPDFREGLKQQENNSLELKTIGVDRIFVANELHKPKIETHLAKDEVGFFSVKVNLPNESEAWPKDLEQLKGIENEIFKLFSPAVSH